MIDTSLQPMKPVTRREAMRAGRRTYRGRPCPVHGEVMRYATNSACVPCAIASARATKMRERALRSSEGDIDDAEDLNPNPVLEVGSL